MRIFWATNLAWVLMLSACAMGPIKTWIIGDSILTENDTHEAISFLQAKGFRCYSQPDDEYWRNKLAAAEECCPKGT